MTNNPTIDGVSRDIVETIVSVHPSDTRYRLAKEELRALLDAPAVERQPIKNASEVAYNLQAENSVLQSTIAQLRIDLGNQTELTKQADCHASQRGKEIAQLQARVQELESGRGEPVAYRHTRHFGEGFGSQSKTSGSQVNAFGKAGVDYDEIFRVTCEPLFAAPPAPVAVVLPDHKDGNGPTLSNHRSYNQGWNSCLDATAALNTSK